MASPVYSQNHWSAASLSGAVAQPIFTADGIHRTVVKNIVLAVGVNVVPGSVQILDGNFVVVASIAAQASDLPMKRTTLSQYGTYVLAEGETWYFLAEGGWTGDTRGDGYLLTLP